jgi:hypothetical protein
MTSNELLMLLAGIAVSCGVLALLLVIYPRIREGSNDVVVASIESALQPFIFDAIMAAYRLSEKAVDQGFERLKGADKKGLADSVYKLLPERVGEHDVAFVKSFVTQERFATLVQNAFDQFDQFYIVRHATFDQEFQNHVAQQKPATSPLVAAAPSA